MMPLLVAVPVSERPLAATIPGTYHAAAKTHAPTISAAAARCSRGMCRRGPPPRRGRGGGARGGARVAGAKAGIVFHPIIYPATNPAICAVRRRESGAVRLLVVGLHQGRIHV